MATTTLDLWQMLKGELSKLFPADIFNTWFLPLNCVENPPVGKMILETSNDFAAMWLQNNYCETLEKALKDVAGYYIAVEFKSVGDDSPAVAPTPKKTTSRPIKTAANTGSLSSGQGLMPQNTFENFVVGAGSQLAHAAAFAIANAPAKAYNPLFLYGNTGLGKTHLRHAVGHHILRQNPNARVV